jgi:hypothetical protein
MPSAAIDKSKIPGWGADLDARNRPASTKEANRESVLDVRGSDEYELIPRQVPRVRILLSTEHKRLTPVFGTACPPKGLSGLIRRAAFRLSEGQKAHWLMLMFADRVDVLESGLAGIVRGESHNPLKEMGLSTELRRGGFRSRFGRHRADTRRWGQELLLAGTAITTLLLVRDIRRERRERREGSGPVRDVAHDSDRAEPLAVVSEGLDRDLDRDRVAGRGPQMGR